MAFHIAVGIVVEEIKSLAQFRDPQAIWSVDVCCL